MTKINRLTQIPTLDDSDLAVVWQDSSERTRAITIANLRKFIQSTDPNADAFVKAELIGDELVLTSHDETETRIDINILPSHSVTELKDMPDELISGYYLKVNDAGTDFVLTPASEVSAAIILEENGTFKGTANVINFDDLNVEITNKIARISTKPVNGSNGEIMKVEDGKLVPSGVMSNKDGSLSLSSGSVDIGPHTISSTGEGIEATNESTGESFSFVFAGQGDDAGPVDRVFGDESVIKTTEDLSLELANHASKLTATAEVRIIKKPIIIKPVAPQTNVTMQITDLNGSDLWTYGPFDIDIDENGDFEFTISSVIDFKVGEYLVTFLSPDGDVTLRGGVSPISGEQIVYAELPFKPFHDETLHNIKTGGEIIREIEAGENVTAEIVDGKLTISADGEELPENPTFKSVNIDTAGSGNPNFAASIHQDGELHTVIDATRELRIKYKDISTGDTATVAGIDNSQAQFLVPILQGLDPVALKKDIPVIPENGYIEKYTRADTDYLQIAYQGKYGDDRNYYPVSISQDSNGWTQAKFTGYMQFKSIDKATGEVGNTSLELRSNRVVCKQLPYYNDDKLATRTNDHIANSASLSDVITSDGQKLTDWINDNPEYEPHEFLAQLFGGKILGMVNWVLSFTTSNNNYNGTFPTSYQQVEIHKNGSSARDFMRAYNKESSTHYFAPYKAGQNPVWNAYAYKTDIDEKIAADKALGIWIGGVYWDTVNDDGNPSDQFDCRDPKHFIDFRKTSISDEQFRVMSTSAVKSAEITIYLNPASGLSSCKFRVKNSDGLYRDKTIRIGEKWRFFLREGAYPYLEKVDDGTISYVEQDEFKAKSGYNRLVSGGGSTYTVNYGQNGSILKISHSTVKVQLLEGMSAENPNGYIKYINSRNADVAFEWYNRNGDRVTNNVPSTCPANTVVEIFADYAKDEYVLNFGQSKVISSVSEDQVQQIVSKSFDSLLQPGDGTATINKHPLPSQLGYVSTYASVIYDDNDRLVIPRTAYDRTLLEIFLEANKSSAYCTLPVATVELLLGRILNPEDIELGIALDSVSSIIPGYYSATTPSNVPSTWAWNGKFIPLTTEDGDANEPNDPVVWLDNDGGYVYSESEAGMSNPSYPAISIYDLMSKNGYTWRHALRRGYIMKDGSFVFDADSPYYVFVIRISGYQTTISKIHPVFMNRGGIKLYPDAISAYVDQEKIREQLDQLNEGLAQGFIYAKEVSVG